MQCHPRLGVGGGNNDSIMKRRYSLAALTVWLLFGLAYVAPAAGPEGVSVAIVYDTSGSMKETVRDKSGRSSPKYVIANRALAEVTRQLEKFSTNQPADKPLTLEAGLFVFSGSSARQAVKFGPFDPQAFLRWSAEFASPNGNTPLGNALTEAGKVVLASPLPRRHVLVITDGENTQGPEPAATFPQLRRLAEQQKKSLAVHFVAFDVDAKVFSGVKKQGATVVGAADEKQLNAQLDFILQKKILLEEEEK